MTTSRISVSMLCMLLLVQGARAGEPGCPGTIQWDGGAGTTAWATATNWSPNQLPAAADDVCLPELAAGVEAVHSTGTHAVHSLAGPGGLQVSGGTLSYSVGSPGLGQLVVSGGTLSGTGDLPVTGPFTWSGGAMAGAGTTSVTDAAFTTFTKDLLDGRSLVTAGTTTWLGTGQIRLSGGASISIVPGALWDVQNNSTLTTVDGTGSLTVPDGATFCKPLSGAGTTTLALPVTHAGTFSVEKGGLSLSASSTVTGEILASTGTTLRFSGGTHALLAGSSVSADSVEVSSGTVTVDGAYQAFRSIFSGGATTFRPTSTVARDGEVFISNMGTVDFSSGEHVLITALSMLGGTLAGSDRVTLLPGTQAVPWSAGEMTGPGITWIQSGILHLYGPSPRDLTGGRHLETGNVTWEETGPLRVGSGATIHTIFDWTLLSDASLLDLGGAGGFTSDSFDAVNRGFHKAGGTGTSVVGIPFTNAGMVRASVGTLQFTAGYTQTEGTTRLDGGTLSATAPLAIQGGSLQGVGTVSASVVSSGTVAPGLSAGILAIAGTYTQTPAGKLAIEVGGLTPGTHHDRLDVTGGVSLSGTLDVALINGFVPQNADTFTILTAPTIGGGFGTLLLPPLPGGLAWSVHHDPSAVVLEVSADFDGDGVGDAGDCAPSDPTAGYVPLEVGGVTCATDKQTLSWTSQAAYAGTGTVYDAVRGLVPQLPVGGAGETCLASGSGTTQVVDAASPAVGEPFYYLVRARNVCDLGTYGAMSGGAPRTTAACP